MAAWCVSDLSPLSTALTAHAQVNLAQVLPADIGAAAAYEAYRIFKYRRERVFDPLGQDVERQREALIAMAVAEGASSLASSPHSSFPRY